MRFDVLTLFPEILSGYQTQSLLKLAIDQGLVEIKLWNLRDWASGKHKSVDDRPFGGGPGMVIMPGPVFDAVEAVRPQHREPGELILLTPAGERLTQEVVKDLATKPPVDPALWPVRGLRRTRAARIEAARDIHRRLRLQRRRSAGNGGDRHGDSVMCRASWATRQASSRNRIAIRAAWNIRSTPGRVNFAA